MERPRKDRGFDAVFFTDGEAWAAHYKALGAFRLASELRQAGYRVLVVDFFGQWCADPDRFRALLSRCISSRTRMVGFSSTFFTPLERGTAGVGLFRSQEGEGVDLTYWPVSAKNIGEFTAFIRGLNPRIRIFYGGNRASRPRAEELLPAGIDYVVQGLSDDVIVDLMKRLESGLEIPCATDSAGLRTVAHDPLAQGFDFRTSTTRYAAEDLIRPGEVLPLETARGCVFRCAFCEYPLLGRKGGSRAHHKSREALALELRENRERWGVTRYVIVDDTFNESLEKLRDFEAARDLAGVDMEFFAYLRLSLLRRFPEQIPLLRDLGIRSAFFGIETLNDQSLRAIGKGQSGEELKDTIEAAKKTWGREVAVFGSLIAGLPHEDEESIREWMEWIYASSLDAFHLNPLYLASSLWPSAIQREPERFGYRLVPGDSGVGWVNDRGFSQEQAVRLCRDWNTLARKSGRNKMGAWFMMLLQRYGKSYDELYGQTQAQFNWMEIGQLREREWETYRDQLLSILA